MFITDTLSRAYRKTTDAAECDNSEVRALEEVYHEEEVSVALKWLLEFKKVTAADSEMQQLIPAIKKLVAHAGVVNIKAQCSSLCIGVPFS